MTSLIFKPLFKNKIIYYGLRSWWLFWSLRWNSTTILRNVSVDDLNLLIKLSNAVLLFQRSIPLNFAAIRVDPLDEKRVEMLQEENLSYAGAVWRNVQRSHWENVQYVKVLSILQWNLSKSGLVRGWTSTLLYSGVLKVERRNEIDFALQMKK